MITKFPTFTKLTLAQQKDIERFTVRFEPYSDFNFTSLFCWSIDNSTEVSMLNDNLVIKLPDYITGKPVYSILGKTNVDSSLEKLLATTKSVRLVPEVVVKSIDHPRQFRFREDQDNFDYIYNLEHLASLSGKKYKAKRQKSNSVKRAFGHKLIVSRSSVINPLVKKDLRRVFDEWAKESKQTTKEIQPEEVAFSRLLELSNHFSLLVSLITLEGRAVGFSVNEILNNKYALCHFEKAVSIHSQFFSFLVNQAAKDVLEYGCKFVNWEQDLGIDGIRKSKSSYHPALFLKKYTVELA